MVQILHEMRQRIISKCKLLRARSDGTQTSPIKDGPKLQQEGTYERVLLKSCNHDCRLFHLQTQDRRLHHIHIDIHIHIQT